jgi:hypothetical protein
VHLLVKRRRVWPGQFFYHNTLLCMMSIHSPRLAQETTRDRSPIDRVADALPVAGLHNADDEVTNTSLVNQNNKRGTGYTYCAHRFCIQDHFHHSSSPRNERRHQQAKLLKKRLLISESDRHRDLTVCQLSSGFTQSLMPMNEKLSK